MKKKNLIILLLIPFIISLLGVITINTAFTAFFSDIDYIEWTYSDVEAFKINSSFQLIAKGVSTSGNTLAEGNNLVWEVKNKDTSIEVPIAEVYKDGGLFFLKTNETEGEVVITCRNEKGTVSRSLSAVIYDKGVIIVSSSVSSSQNNIDQDIYYGTLDYDTALAKTVAANFDLTVVCYPKSLYTGLEILETSSNVTAKFVNTNTVNVKFTNDLASKDASIKIYNPTATYVNPTSFDFKIVDKGVNVYEYEELLACTNKSKNGEIVVLRKSFESLSYYQNNSTSNNVSIFGNYDSKTKKFNFSNEIVSLDTTYNSEYIKQWNQFAMYNNQYNTIADNINVGLYVQKDFYGNGYTINFHNLAYPSGYSEVTADDGTKYNVPILMVSDLFRGPLPYYCLGDPNGLPLVTAYGQDNVGMYIAKNGVTVNDVVVKNCDTVSSLSFLETVGTVVEVAADNVTIQNSRLTNGKNVLRSFSSMDFTLHNSLLSNSMNFLFVTGSNEYVKVSGNDTFTFVNDETGATVTTTLKEYLSTTSEGLGDELLNKYLSHNFTDAKAMRKCLDSIQHALDSKADSIKNQYKGSTVVSDTYFYNSGLASICCESMFNGPFLYSSAPSTITALFELVSSGGNKSLVPYTPTNVGGVSYPVTLSLEGNTKFYDYKVADDIDLSGLIHENISSVVSDFLGSDVTVDIDDIFPLKTLLLQNASGCIYRNTSGEKTTRYINVPVAYYGGGTNLCVVDYSKLSDSKQIFKSVDTDFTNSYLNSSSGDGLMGIMNQMMKKSVTVVTGTEPFTFVCLNSNGYLYGEAPKISDLQENAKGE